jgi:hypothetical protein
MRGLLERFALKGHNVRPHPDADTGAVLTTARYGEPVEWRDAPMFTARKRFNLNHNPTAFTFVYMRAHALQHELQQLATALQEDPPDPADFVFPGLTPLAPPVLIEQGLRGGPILALLRVLQAQTKCFRVVLVVEDDSPVSTNPDTRYQAYHFDLVGAHPRSEGQTWDSLYDDIVMRMATTLSASEVADHEVVGEPVPLSIWQSLSTPAEIMHAARELAHRGFFTEAVEIARLVRVPVVPGVVASQYSEGCFATWDATLGALITTVTGSARPVNKGSIHEDDLALVVGVRADHLGALVRHVQGRRNDPPSSEALELADMDGALPTVDCELRVPGLRLSQTQSSNQADRHIETSPSSNQHSALRAPHSVKVPVVRSKLHGHRGISAYSPEHVEYAQLDPPYYRYLVSCATGAQALGIKHAFARAEALRNPDDPRRVVFTILPGHGVVIVEKWVPRTAPFTHILRCIDEGYLQIDSRVPQGPMWYEQDPSGLCVLKEG